MRLFSGNLSEPGNFELFILFNLFFQHYTCAQIVFNQYHCNSSHDLFLIFCKFPMRGYNLYYCFHCQSNAPPHRWSSLSSFEENAPDQGRFNFCIHKKRVTTKASYTNICNKTNLFTSVVFQSIV